MNSRSRLALLLALLAAFALGALSDPLVSSVSAELLRRSNHDRMLVDWFSPVTGMDYPEARAYFLGRSEGAAQARELLLRASDTGGIELTPVP